MTAGTVARTGLWRKRDLGMSDVERSLDWSDGAAWIDGAYCPIREAKLSVLDWGFTHSDVTYDVAHVWDGAFFRLDDHLERFQRSMAAARLKPAQSTTEIAEILHGCVARSGLRESYVAFVCTRGAPRVKGSRDPRDCENRFFAYAVPFIWVIPQDIGARGARMLAPSDVRRIPVDSVDPTAKNYHWGDFTQGLIAAKEAGYDNTFLLDHQDRVTEGPGFNVFAVFGDEVATPDAGTLLGVTRRTMLELADELGYRATSRPIPFSELLEADEVFIATTGGGAVPVTEVNGRTFGNGAPGATTQKLASAYWRIHEEGRYSTPVNYEVG